MEVYQGKSVFGGIAIGRISNESQYAKSLLGTDKDNSLGKQLTDMMSKALV